LRVDSIFQGECEYAHALWKEMKRRHEEDENTIKWVPVGRRWSSETYQDK
jgi:hypothetical protein